MKNDDISCEYHKDSERFSIPDMVFTFEKGGFRFTTEPKEPPVELKEGQDYERKDDSSD